MRIGAACSLVSAWQREASTASWERRFRLTSSHRDERIRFAKCSSCFQKSHTPATLHLGLFVHWVQSSAGSDAMLLGPPARGPWELVVGSHLARLFLDGMDSSLA